jgi:hypothetical protein
VSPPRGFWANIAQEQGEELRLLQQSPHTTYQGKEQSDMLNQTSRCSQKKKNGRLTTARKRRTV